MAPKDRRPVPALTAKLLSREMESDGRNFCYFQAVRLLELLHRRDKSLKLRTRPELTLAFPTADITEIRYTEEEQEAACDLTVTFMGLYGTSSPLPTFYTEELFLETSRDQTVQKDFLDIFNQRIYDLLYLCWEKYQLFFQVAEKENRKPLEKLFCLLGLGEPELRGEEVDSRELIRYLGLVTQWPRSALGLETMLKDAANQTSLEIEPCIPRTVNIPEEQRCCLGMACSSLGRDTVIGSQITDRQGKFRIKIGPVSAREFQELMPDGPVHRKLLRLTRFYLTVPLEYEISVRVRHNEVENAMLGGRNWARLGMDTWLYSDKMEQDANVTFYPDQGRGK